MIFIYDSIQHSGLLNDKTATRHMLRMYVICCHIDSYCRPTTRIIFGNKNI